MKIGIDKFQSPHQKGSLHPLQGTLTERSKSINLSYYFQVRNHKSSPPGFVALS